MTTWFWISLAVPVLAAVVTVSFLLRTRRLRGGWELLAVLIGFGVVLLVVVVFWATRLANE